MADKVYGLVYILCKDPERAPHIYPIKEKEVKVGRSLSCDIRIVVSNVSEEHCVLNVDSEEQVSISVLDERNFIYVNGWPIHHQLLNHGDVFTIVDKSFRFEYMPDSLYYSGGTLHTAPLYDNSSKVMSPMATTSVSEMGNTSVQKRISKETLTTNAELGILKKNIGISELEKRSRVSFGPYLSPEQFDKNMAPATPLKKGGVPTPLKNATVELRQCKFKTGNGRLSLNKSASKSQLVESAKKKRSVISKRRLSLNLKRKTAAAVHTPLRKVSTALSHSRKTKSISPVVEEMQAESRVTRRMSLNFQAESGSKNSEPANKLSDSLNVTEPEKMLVVGQKSAMNAGSRQQNQFSQAKTATAEVSSSLITSPQLSMSRKKKVANVDEASCLTPAFLEHKKSTPVEGRKKAKSFPPSEPELKRKRVSSCNINNASELKEKITDVGEGGVTGGLEKQLIVSVTPVVSPYSVDTSSRRGSTRLVKVPRKSKSPSPRSIILKPKKVAEVSTPLRKCVAKSPYVKKTKSLSPPKKTGGLEKQLIVSVTPVVSPYSVDTSSRRGSTGLVKVQRKSKSPSPRSIILKPKKVAEVSTPLRKCVAKSPYVKKTKSPSPPKKTGGLEKQLIVSVTPVVSPYSVDTSSRRGSTRLVKVPRKSKSPSPRSIILKPKKVAEVSTPLRKCVAKSPYVKKTKSLSPPKKTGGLEKQLIVSVTPVVSPYSVDTSSRRGSTGLVKVQRKSKSPSPRSIILKPKKVAEVSTPLRKCVAKSPYVKKTKSPSPPKKTGGLEKQLIVSVTPVVSPYSVDTSSRRGSTGLVKVQRKSKSPSPRSIILKPKKVAEVSTPLRKCVAKSPYVKKTKSPSPPKKTGGLEKQLIVSVTPVVSPYSVDTSSRRGSTGLVKVPRKSKSPSPRSIILKPKKVAEVSTPLRKCVAKSPYVKKTKSPSPPKKTGGLEKQLIVSVTPVVSPYSVDTSSRRGSTRLVKVPRKSKSPSPRSIILKPKKVAEVSTPLRKCVAKSPYVRKTKSLSPPKKTRKKTFVTKRMSLASKLNLSSKAPELESKKITRSKGSMPINKVINVSKRKMPDDLIQDQVTDLEISIVHSPLSTNTQQSSASRNKKTLRKVPIKVSTPLQKRSLRSSNTRSSSFSPVVKTGSNTATRKSLKTKIDSKQSSGCENASLNADKVNVAVNDVTLHKDLVQSANTVSPVAGSMTLISDQFYCSETKTSLGKIQFVPSVIVTRKVVTKGSTSLRKLSPGSSVKARASSSLDGSGNKENKSNVTKKTSLKNVMAKSPPVKSTILKQKNDTESSLSRKVSLRSGRTIEVQQTRSVAIAKGSVVNEQRKVSKTVADVTPHALSNTVNKASKSSKNKNSIGMATTLRSKKKFLHTKVPSATKKLNGSPRYPTRSKKSSNVGDNSQSLRKDHKKASIAHDQSNLSLKKSRQLLKGKKQNTRGKKLCDETLQNVAFDKNVSLHVNEMENFVDESSCSNASKEKGKKVLKMDSMIGSKSKKVSKRKHSGELIESSVKLIKTRLSMSNCNENAENVSRVTRKKLKALHRNTKVDEKKNAQPTENMTSGSPVKKSLANRNTRKQKSNSHEVIYKTSPASSVTTESSKKRSSFKTKVSKRVLRSRNISLQLSQADKQVNYKSNKTVTSPKEEMIPLPVEKSQMKKKSRTLSKEGKEKPVTKSPAAQANKKRSETGESTVRKRTTRAAARRMKK